MSSRLTSDAFIPSVPMVTPSLIAMVLNSIGVPPAARTPRLTCSARRRRSRLHGIVSTQVLAMPIERLVQVLVAEAGALEHRPRGGAVGAVEEDAAVLTGIHGAAPHSW